VTIHGSGVSAVLTARGPGDSTLSWITATWPLYGGPAMASVTPSGATGTMPAPEGVSF
jgi:hypothetical protein